MEHISRTADQIVIDAFVALTIDDLTAIYHETAERLVDAGLDEVVDAIGEAMMEYEIDPIHEAADDEERTSLKILAAGAILTMQKAQMRHDIDTATQG